MSKILLNSILDLKSQTVLLSPKNNLMMILELTNNQMSNFKEPWGIIFWLTEDKFNAMDFLRDNLVGYDS